MKPRSTSGPSAATSVSSRVSRRAAASSASPSSGTPLGMPHGALRLYGPEAWISSTSRPPAPRRYSSVPADCFMTAPEDEPPSRQERQDAFLALLATWRFVLFMVL